MQKVAPSMEEDSLFAANLFGTSISSLSPPPGLCACTEDDVNSCSLGSFGLPPGLEDLIESWDAAETAPEDASDLNVELVDASDDCESGTHDAAFAHEDSQFWASSMHHPETGNELSYGTSMLAFDITGQQCVGIEQGLAASWTEIDGSGEAYDLSGEEFADGFDFWQSQSDMNGQAYGIDEEQFHVDSGCNFDAGGDAFDGTDQSFNVSSELFDGGMQWCCTSSQELHYPESYGLLADVQMVQEEIFTTEHFATSHKLTQATNPTILSTNPRCTSEADLGLFEVPAASAEGNPIGTFMPAEKAYTYGVWHHSPNCFNDETSVTYFASR